MLKQLFNKESILKVLSAKDIWRWKIIDQFGDCERAAKHISVLWQKSGINIQPLRTISVKGKVAYRAQSLEDTLALKLVDRYVRRIYKVRQSDRNRMVKQLITLLKDPGEFTFIRFDIKSCYENINFRNMLTKLKDDLILSPTCIKVLEQAVELTKSTGQSGLPRGLPISATLAELYLETLDMELAQNENIIYSARYVDDYIVVTPSSEASKTQDFINRTLDKLKLALNEDKSSVYQIDQVNDSIELLGYCLTSKRRSAKPNNVVVTISEKKIKKIKTRIVLSLLDYKQANSMSMFKLLKDRIYYLSTLRVVKKGKNGYLLAGNAYNYSLAGDLSCLKKIDKFYHGLILRNQNIFSSPELIALRKVSFYGNAKSKKIMELTKNKSSRIQQVWRSKNE